MEVAFHHSYTVAPLSPIHSNPSKSLPPSQVLFEGSLAFCLDDGEELS